MVLSGTILYGNSAIEFAGHGNDPEKLEPSLSSRKIGSPEQQKKTVIMKHHTQHATIKQLLKLALNSRDSRHRKQ